MTSLLLLFGAIPAALGQGTVSFANDGSSLCLVCENGGFVPAPTGSAFQVALYYAPDGTEAEFYSVAVRLGVGVGFGPVPGRFNGGTRTAPIATPGGFGLFQVRGWQTAFGNSYEEVLVNSWGGGMVGVSPILRIDTGNPTTTPVGVPTPLFSAGFRGLYISPLACPEPPPVMLGSLVVAGALICTLLRRRCRR